MVLFQALKVCLFSLVLFGWGVRCDWCGARLGVLLRFVARRASAERGWLRLVHGLAGLGVLLLFF